jgi:hypothetical protein
MEKMPFTPEGVCKKQEEINQLPKEERLKISEQIAIDTTNWVVKNFELTDEQVEYLKGLEIIDSKIMGLGLAIGILGQIPIRMEETKRPIGAKGKKEKQVSVSVSTTYNPNTHSTSVSGSVSFSWKW